MRIIFNILQFLLANIIAFYKNILYKGYIKLKHYLNLRYLKKNLKHGDFQKKLNFNFL